MSRPGPPAARVLISAHRCNTLTQVHEALALGVDLVEFDVDRAGDGALYVGHGVGAAAGGLGAHPAAAEAPALGDVLDLLRAGDVVAHLDLKFPPDPDGSVVDQVGVVAEVVAALGVARVVVTTRDDAVVRGVRDWADGRVGIDTGDEPAVPGGPGGAPGLRIGLSLGGSLPGLPWGARLVGRWSEVRPRRRLAACGADVVVAQWAVASLGAARAAHRARMPLLVWTVDPPALLRHWLRPGRAWALTSNRPDLAVRLRGLLTVRQPR